MNCVIGTVSGKLVDYLDPDPAQFDIEDIVIGLQNNCRFAGQIETHYSVCQHSVRVAQKVWVETGDLFKSLQGLLHDGSEAYTNDIPTPLKRALGDGYRLIERRLQTAIYEKFGGLPYLMFDEVHDADQRWLITERNQFQPRHFEWSPEYESIVPYNGVIEVWNANRARHEFRAWYKFLSGESNVHPRSAA